MEPIYTTAVISDIHGDVEALKRLLKKIGHIDEAIFIGDIIDVGQRAKPEEDLATIEFIRDYKGKKRILFGNHDFPFLLDKWAGVMYFYGLRDKNSPFLDQHDHEILWEIWKVASELDWEFATDVGDTLITHAGFDVRWWEHYDLEGEPTLDGIMELIAGAVDQMWEEPDPRRLSGVIGNISKIRGGQFRCIPGILWADYTELQHVPSVPQIVGHSFIGLRPLKRDNVWFIDSGYGHPSAVINRGEGWVPVPLLSEDEIAKLGAEADKRRENMKYVE